MSRKHAPDYAGARGRLALEAAAGLGPRWALQPKVDGQYVRLTLDARGHIAHVYSRTGRPVATDLVGCFVGWPHAELVGELEAHTEAGTRAAAARGYACVHLFDCIRTGRGRYIAGEPYAHRRAELQRMRAEVINMTRDRDWSTDRNQRAHGPDGRYTRPVPRGWRRALIVEQVSPRRAQALWDDVMNAGGEGLVAVALDAPLGRRGSKKKIKASDTLDCEVLRVDGRSVLLRAWGQYAFACGTGGYELLQGDMVEVTSDGVYADGTPRFPRVTAVRCDLH